ncbi:MAG TPA: hypothetical protein PLT47_05420 [Bacteroidales bacterium]|nr:hypothetical protein [Bacteroidales bacterium]HQI70168.1 hypothetical protein [Bacteroidales bacterium]
MEFEEQYARISVPSKKQGTLRNLCLISLFFSGSMTLFSFGGFFFSGWLSDYIQTFWQGFYGFGKSYLLLFFLGMFILFGSSFTGTLLMFRMKRPGYWIYLAANVIMLFLSFFVVMTFFNAIFILGSTVFIVLYSIQYKYLKK